MPKKSAPTRGERLDPPRSSRLYWVLTCLREEIARVGAHDLAGIGVSGTRLIDFGCGDAPYRALLSRYVAEYIGCDLPGNEDADCTLDRAGRLPFGAETADVILSSQVLEHAGDPGLYLEECRRVLKPGGRLVLSTHGVWRYHSDPQDLWRWTSAGLRRVVEGADFSIHSFRGILGPAATALQLWQDAVLPRIPRAFRTSFARIMQSSIRSADRACSPAARDADASVYLLVASKTTHVHRHSDSP